MKLPSTKLREIVLQEVRIRLVETYVDQEFSKLIKEDAEEDYNAAKWKARKRKARDIALGALGMGAGIGGLKMATDQHADTKAAKHAELVAQNVQAAESDEAQFRELGKQLNNQYAFRWGKGNDSVVHAPGSDGKITVLPPSYSVMVKVMQDKKTNAERMKQGLRPIERYGEIDTDLRAKDIYQTNRASDTYSDKGDMGGDIEDFFKVHKGEFVDAMQVVGSHDELQVVPGSGMEQAIIMVNPDSIDANTYLPAVGMSASDYYNLQYGQYMGSGEAAALDGPEDNEVSDSDSEINPELVQNTTKRAQRDIDNLQKKRVKEHMVTWRNYKNRKKILA